MSKTMTKKMKDAAKTYKLDEISTPEKLELQGFKTIAYGTETICIGYFYSPDGKCYYTATYEAVCAACNILDRLPNMLEDDEAKAWIEAQRGCRA